MTDQTPIDVNHKDGQVLRVIGTLSGVQHYNTKPTHPDRGRVWASGRLAHSLGDITAVFNADLIDSDPRLADLLTRGYPVGVDITARLEAWGYPLDAELIPPDTCQLWALTVQLSSAQVTLDTQRETV